MLLKTAIICDSNGGYVTCAAIKNNEPLYYVLAEGERIEYEAPLPPPKKRHAEHNGFLIPIFQNGEWIESATETELIEWCLQNPKPTYKPTRKALGEQANTDIDLDRIAQGQQITQLELNDVEHGQYITDIELILLKGV